MTPFMVFGANAAAHGSYIQLLVEATVNTPSYAIMAHHRLDSVAPNMWYPQQIILDALSDIAAEPNGDAILTEMGIAFSRYLPARSDNARYSFPDTMIAYAKAYNKHHFGDDVGYIDIEPVDDHYLILHQVTPYPTDFTYGIYIGMSQRFLMDMANFTIEFVQDELDDHIHSVHITWHDTHTVIDDLSVLDTDLRAAS